MLWVLIRIASFSIKIYAVGTHENEAKLMSTHNICFYGELTKIILLLSSNTVPSLSVLLTKQRLWSDCLDAQTDLSFCWVHMWFCEVLPCRRKWSGILMDWFKDIISVIFLVLIWLPCVMKCNALILKEAALFSASRLSDACESKYCENCNEKQPCICAIGCQLKSVR